MELTLEIPDKNKDLIIEYFVKSLGYTDQVSDNKPGAAQVPNPESMLKAANRLLIEYMKDHSMGYKMAMEIEKARAQTKPVADDLWSEVI